MGVNGLWSLVAPTSEAKLLERYKDFVLCIDNIWLHQFTKGMKDKKTGETMKAAHIIGAFIRLCKLMFFGVRPVFVFDGATPQMKLRTTQERRARKVAAGNQAQKVALKLFRQQLKLAALTAAENTAVEQAARENISQASPANGAQGDDVLTELPEDFVYLRDTGTVVPGQGSSESAGGGAAAKTKNSPAKRSRTKSNRDVDEYELEDAQSLDTSALDPRLISEEEMRRFVKKHRQRATNIDIDDAAFRALPLEQQHDIVTDLKNRSRQANHGRLMRMAAASNGDPLSFSAMQIHGLMKRNKLTQKLYAIAKQPGPSTSEAKARAAQLAAKPTRVASERSRQYMLVKNDPKETGFTIKSSRVLHNADTPKNGRTSASSAVIDVDRLFDEQQANEAAKGPITHSELLDTLSDQTQDEEEDWEDIELPSVQAADLPSSPANELALAQGNLGIPQDASSNLKLDDDDLQFLEALMATSAPPLPENGDFLPDDMPIEDIEAAFAAAEADAPANGADSSQTFSDFQNKQDLVTILDSDDQDDWEELEVCSVKPVPQHRSLQPDAQQTLAKSLDAMDIDNVYGDAESVSSHDVATPVKQFSDDEEIMNVENLSNEGKQFASSPLSIWADPRNYAPDNIAAQEIRELIDKSGPSGEAADFSPQRTAQIDPQRRKAVHKAPQPPPQVAGSEILYATAQEVLKCTNAEDAIALWSSISTEAFEEVYPDFLERTHQVLCEWDTATLEEESARIHKVVGKQTEGSTQAQIHEVWRTVVAVSLEWRLTRARNETEESAAKDEQSEVQGGGLTPLSGLPKRMLAQSEHSTPTTGSGPETPFNGATPVDEHVGGSRKKRVELFRILKTSGPNSPERVLVPLTNEEEPMDAADLIFSTDVSPGAVDDMGGYYFTVTDKMSSGAAAEPGITNPAKSKTPSVLPAPLPRASSPDNNAGIVNFAETRPLDEPPYTEPSLAQTAALAPPQQTASGDGESSAKDLKMKENRLSEVPVLGLTPEVPPANSPAALNLRSQRPLQIASTDFADLQLEATPASPLPANGSAVEESAGTEMKSKPSQLSPNPASLPPPADNASPAEHHAPTPASPGRDDIPAAKEAHETDQQQTIIGNDTNAEGCKDKDDLTGQTQAAVIDTDTGKKQPVPDETDSPYDNDSIEIEDEETNVDVPTEMSAEMEENARFFAQITNSSREEVARDLEEQVISLNAQKRKHETNAAELSTDMTKDLQAMTRMFGIPYITAPMEAEAQCAWLLSNKLVDGIVSEDSDGWLFGAQKLLKNIFNQHKYVEEYTMERITNMMALDREKLVQLAYLLGSDYTPGIPGIGPTLGLEVLNLWQGSKLEPLHKFREWWEMVYADPTADAENDNPAQKKLRKILREKPVPQTFPDERVWDAYYHPQVDKDMRPFEWGEPHLDELRDFMEEKAEWPQNKVDQYLIPIIKERQRVRSGAAAGSSITVQTSLDRFFSGIGSATKSHKSARIQSIVDSWKTGETAGPPPPTGRKRRASANADEDGQVNPSPLKRARKMAKKSAAVAPEDVPADDAQIDAAPPAPKARKRKAPASKSGDGENGDNPPKHSANRKRATKTLPVVENGGRNAADKPTPAPAKRTRGINSPATAADEGGDADGSCTPAKRKRTVDTPAVIEID
ncbi:DNA repair protein rad2 [Geranomyces variabilis]|uniref:DNA repair protein rad2 n=1 Tax=Geranomyces variabilis TaxID=109894 RepID=A0AAD5TGW4_9FUNG|nr:DNA repair protein rad2 [Geranomyces variabilis]